MNWKFSNDTHISLQISGTNSEEQQKMFGRHFEIEDELVSHISRKSIDILKTNYRVCFCILAFSHFRKVYVMLAHRNVHLCRMICQWRTGDWLWNWRTCSRYNEILLCFDGALRGTTTEKMSCRVVFNYFSRAPAAKGTEGSRPSHSLWLKLDNVTTVLREFC